MTLLSCRANSRLLDPFNIERKASAQIIPHLSRQHTHTTDVDFIQCYQGLSGFKLRTSNKPNPSRHSAKCQTVITVVNMTTRPRRSFRPKMPNSLEQATLLSPSNPHHIKMCNVHFWHFGCALRRQEWCKLAFGLWLGFFWFVGLIELLFG